MHMLLIGFLLDRGVAIPFGPINLEIIRHDLHLDTLFSIIFGLIAI